MTNSSPVKTFLTKYLPSRENFVRKRQKSKFSTGRSHNAKARIDIEHKENSRYNFNSPKIIKTEIRLTFFNHKDQLENVGTKRISRKLKMPPSSALRYHTNRKWKKRTVVKETKINTPLKTIDSSSFFLESNELKRSSLLNSKNYPNRKILFDKIEEERKYERPSRKYDTWEPAVGSFSPNWRKEKSENVPVPHILKDLSSSTLIYQTNRKWKTHAIIKERKINAPLNKSVSKSFVESNNITRPSSIELKNHLNSKWISNNSTKQRRNKQPLKISESLVEEPHRPKRSHSLTLRNDLDRKWKNKQPLKKPGSWNSIVDSRKPKRLSCLTLSNHQYRQWKPNEIPKEKIINRSLDRPISWTKEQKKPKGSSHLTLISHKNRQWQTNVITKKAKTYSPLEKSVSLSLVSESHRLRTSPSLTSRNHLNRKLRSNATVTVRRNNKLLKKRLAKQSDFTINATKQKPIMYWVETELKYLIAFPIDKQKPKPVDERKVSTHSRTRSDNMTEEIKELDSQGKNSLNVKTAELRSSDSTKRKSSEPHISFQRSVSSSHFSAEMESFEPRSKAKPAPKRRGLFCCLKPAPSPPISAPLLKENKKRGRTLSSVPSIYSWQDSPSNIHDIPDITSKHSNGKRESGPRTLKETKNKKGQSFSSSLNSENKYSQSTPLNSGGTNDENKFISEEKADKKLNFTKKPLRSSSLDSNLDSFESRSKEKDSDKNEWEHHPSTISISEKKPFKQTIKSRELPSKKKWEPQSTKNKILVPQQEKTVLRTSSYDRKPSQPSSLRKTSKPRDTNELDKTKKGGKIETWVKESFVSISSTSKSSSSSSSSLSSSSISEKKPSQLKTSTAGKSNAKNLGRSKNVKRKLLGTQKKESFVSISSNEYIHYRSPHSPKRRFPVQKDWGPRTPKVNLSSSSDRSSISSNEKKTYRLETLTSGKRHDKRKEQPHSMKRKTLTSQKKEHGPKKSKPKSMRPRIKESFTSISSSETEPQHSTPRKPPSKKKWEPNKPKEKELGRRVKESFLSSSSSEKKPQKFQNPSRKRRPVRRKEPLTRQKGRPPSHSSSVTKLSLLPYLTLGKVLPKLKSEPDLKGKELTPEEKDKFWRSLNPEIKGEHSEGTQNKPHSPPVSPRKSTGKNGRSSPRRTESFLSTESSLSITSFTSERSSKASDKSKKRNPLGRLFCLPRSKAK